MTEWALKVMRFCNAEPLLYACIAFALFIVTLKFIGWHRDHFHTFYILA